MELRIGITQSMKDVTVDLPDDADRDAIEAQLSAGAGSDQLMWLTDRKGRRYGVPGSKIAFVEFDSSAPERRVGFGA